MFHLHFKFVYLTLANILEDGSTIVTLNSSVQGAKLKPSSFSIPHLLPMSEIYSSFVAVWFMLPQGITSSRLLPSMYWSNIFLNRVPRALRASISKHSPEPRQHRHAKIGHAKLDMRNTRTCKSCTQNACKSRMSMCFLTLATCKKSVTQIIYLGSLPWLECHFWAEYQGGNLAFLIRFFFLIYRIFPSFNRIFPEGKSGEFKGKIWCYHIKLIVVYKRQEQLDSTTWFDGLEFVRLDWSQWQTEKKAALLRISIKNQKLTTFQPFRPQAGKC